MSVRPDVGSSNRFPPTLSTRLDVLASIFDPWTRAHLDARGLSAGWRCWEVGAGGPNTVRWLAERVGLTGHVLATDLDPRWAAAAIGANVSVLAHDVAEAPPESGFDLIHARLVLTHVPERERALRNLAGALRPGGRLVVEDPDPDLLPLSCLDGPDEARELANRLRSCFRSMLAARGGALAFRRRLPSLLSGLGHCVVAVRLTRRHLDRGRPRRRRPPLRRDRPATHTTTAHLDLDVSGQLVTVRWSSVGSMTRSSDSACHACSS